MACGMFSTVLTWATVHSPPYKNCILLGHTTHHLALSSLQFLKPTTGLVLLSPSIVSHWPQVPWGISSVLWRNRRACQPYWQDKKRTQCRGDETITHYSDYATLIHLASRWQLFKIEHLTSLFFFLSFECGLCTFQCFVLAVYVIRISRDVYIHNNTH